jgi:hypothetical protein
MSTAHLALASLAAALLTAPQVEFSGTWAPVAGASKPADLPLGGPIRIEQGSLTFTLGLPDGSRRTYRLDGLETQRTEKDGADVITVTTSARWAGAALVITERYRLATRETNYALESESGNMVVTSATTLLHTRGGRLTVSTIGPFVRVYRKVSPKLVPADSPGQVMMKSTQYGALESLTCAGSGAR